MGILGNMQLRSSCSRCLTLYTYQIGYYECGGSQRYHYGLFEVHKLPFAAPKFRLRRVQKMKQKRKKGKIVFCKKDFCILACSRVGYGSRG